MRIVQDFDLSRTTGENPHTYPVWGYLTATFAISIQDKHKSFTRNRLAWKAKALKRAGIRASKWNLRCLPPTQSPMCLRPGKLDEFSHSIPGDRNRILFLAPQILSWIHWHFCHSLLKLNEKKKDRGFLWGSEKKKTPQEAWGAVSLSKMMSRIAGTKVALVRKGFLRLPQFGRSFCRQNSNF